LWSDALQGPEKGLWLTDPTFIYAAGSIQPTRSVSNDMPQFAATFVPGGYDDYSMPEMYAPAPQR
jgi:hypothetical protein